jgi:multidrug efflux pump
MGFSAPFIGRPVATVMLAFGLFLSGLVAYWFLPVAALPGVDIPTIVVVAARPGADPDTMAASVAAPLERRLGEIAGVTELTSTSTIGNTSIVIQFDINRDISGAAADVMAAINAATTDLPADLPRRPYYRKFNPAAAPILALALSSDTLSTAQIYDAVDTILAQRLAQVPGVSQITVNGAEKPAIRIQLDPVRLSAARLSAQDVYAITRAANVIGATGGFQGDARAETVTLNHQMTTAAEYRDLVIRAPQAGGVVRLSDVATVIDGVANARLSAWNGSRPAILMSITKDADANVIETVDAIKALLPQLLTWMPTGIEVALVADRTATIRANVADIQFTMMISIALVVLVVALFMRRLVPTIAAVVTVPLSLCGTLAGMWAFDYTVNNFTLMALTIAVGFVVDDAIVMIENIVRHMERGSPPLRAALDGARQIGFTVVSISISLVAVFIPLIFMGGVIGRLFHEFALTLTLAIAISALVSLTLTPMICGRFMRARDITAPRGRFWRGADVVERGMQRGYALTLGWALSHRVLMLLVTVLVMALTVRLYMVVPKGFLPIQDTGIIVGSTLADPNISFQAMEDRQRAVLAVIQNDPAVAAVISTVGVSSGWSAMNRATLTISLKPLAERGLSSEAVIARLRPHLFRVRGVQTFLSSAQDLRGGGRTGGSQFQYVLISQDIEVLRTRAADLQERLRQTPGLADVTSDQDRAGPQVNVVIDRDAAARLGVRVLDIDLALNNAFAQRQVSTIYAQSNQYRVVLEIDPALQLDPSALDRIQVGAAGGRQVPLSSVARFERGYAPLAVRHQGQLPAATLSFNLAPGVSLGDATELIDSAVREMRMPDSIRGEFAGNARWLRGSLATQPMLVLAAIIAIYIVLGVLYESVLHPLTILSTLPSAGLGALLALWLSGTELTLMAMIGIILLMGIVKKNAIMMVDFALEAERERSLSPFEAIHEACLARFRPIMMTTIAALLGAVPLALGTGTGSEFRVPLGIAIIGGLIVSQVLTLYTTPVVYLSLERLTGRRRTIRHAAPAQ